MADRNEQTDADILQCKADILRARDIIQGTPPQEKKTDSEPNSEKTGENTEAAPLPVEKTNHTDTVKQPEPERVISSIQEIQVEQVKSGNDIPVAPTDVEQQKIEIPKFDLAEEIMAEQRKITSIRRKGPSKKVETQSREPEAELIGYTIEQPTQALLEQEQIVAEIVARDIERMCKRGTSGIQE
jgi:hypothetical protein